MLFNTYKCININYTEETEPSEFKKTNTLFFEKITLYEIQQIKNHHIISQ